MRTEPRPRVTRTKFGEDRTRNFQNMFADKHTNRQSDTVVAKLRLPYTGAGGGRSNNRPLLVEQRCSRKYSDILACQ